MIYAIGLTTRIYLFMTLSKTDFNLGQHGCKWKLLTKAPQIEFLKKSVQRSRSDRQTDMTSIRGVLFLLKAKCCKTGIRYPRRHEFFCSPSSPDGLWGTSSLSLNRHKICLSLCKSVRSWSWPSLRAVYAYHNVVFKYNKKSAYSKLLWKS
jgi:hypothetical protein